MLESLKNFPSVQAVNSIVSDAGGTVVGRTRLQKIAYILYATGLDDSFDFEYKHFGPYSRDLTQAVDFAKLAGVISEESRPASWGGSYSIYTAPATASDNALKKQLIGICNNADSVVLELAATAAFLSNTHSSPWEETKSRKPVKATSERVVLAKALIAELNNIPTPTKISVEAS